MKLNDFNIKAIKFTRDYLTHEDGVSSKRAYAINRYFNEMMRRNR